MQIGGTKEIKIAVVTVKKNLHTHLILFQLVNSVNFRQFCKTDYKDFDYHGTGGLGIEDECELIFISVEDREPLLNDLKQKKY